MLVLVGCLAVSSLSSRRHRGRLEDHTRLQVTVFCRPGCDGQMKAAERMPCVAFSWEYVHYTQCVHTVLHCVHTVHVCTYTVCTVYTIHSVHTIYDVYTIHGVYTIHCVHTIHGVYTIHSVHTIHGVYAVHAVYTIHSVQYTLGALCLQQLPRWSDSVKENLRFSV